MLSKHPCTAVFLISLTPPLVASIFLPPSLPAFLTFYMSYHDRFAGLRTFTGKDYIGVAIHVFVQLY